MHMTKQRMSAEEFEALLVRRAELESDLEEYQAEWWHPLGERKIRIISGELESVQADIDAELAAEEAEGE
jgi:hypothetical protein